MLSKTVVNLFYNFVDIHMHKKAVCRKNYHVPDVATVTEPKLNSNLWHLKYKQTVRLISNCKS